MEVPDDDYKSVISADNGFEGFLDEFGLYFLDDEGRSNIDNDIFKRRITRRYNPDKIIAAYGFDGLYFDDSPFTVSLGSANLDYKSALKFLETDFNFSYLYIDIDFEQISEGTELQISFPEMTEAETIIIL